VSIDELRRWNDLDPSARLQEGMTLQAFVGPAVDLSHVVLLAESEARTVPAGSDDFFSYYEGTKGRRRITVTAKAGETLDQIGRRYGVSAALMERINHKPRSEALKEGDIVVVHTPSVPGGAVEAPRPTGLPPLPTGGAVAASAATTATTTPNVSGTARDLEPPPPVELSPGLP
jgi:membrane-bound lytic murein transglycosylase D